MDNNFNKLILRQIKKHFGSVENLPENMHAFVTDINSTYINHDEEAKLLQNALDVSSQELREAFLKKKQDFEKQKGVINKIKEAIYALNPLGQSFHPEDSENEPSYLFDSLIEMIEERKMMEQTLKESEFYLREILDSRRLVSLLLILKCIIFCL